MSDEDDDGPVVFKRNNTISKQSNSRTQKSPSRKHEETEANVSGVQSIVKNCQIALASKMSSTKDPTPRSNSLTYENSKDSSSKNSFDLDTEERPSNMPPFEPLNESEDSEDYQPLSLRLSLSLSKGKSNNLPKGPISSAPGFSHSPKTKGGTAISHYSDDDILLASKLQPKSSTRPSSKLLNSNGFNLPTPDLSLLQNIKNDIKNDSEDEIPLSVKFHYKAALGSSSSKIGNADQKLPLASKIPKADVSRDGNQIMKSSKCGPSKRCLDEDDNGLKYSAKKAKVLDATDNKNVKEVPKKSEPEGDDEDEDNIPIAKRMKKPTPSNDKLISQKNLEYKVVSSSLKETKKFKKIEKNTMYSKSVKAPPTSGEGQKWTTLVHNGVIFPLPYKPHGVKMLYEGKPVDLTPEQEEVATMFAVMKDTDYATKSRFIENFMNDWKKLLGKNHIIRDIALCDFTPIYDWHQREKEKKKQMSAEEKKILKEEKLKQEDKYMWAIVDGVKEKVGNFRVEPPGLFRGRGEHPKMGKLKRRISPSEITINIGKDAPIPECPIPGESWKEVKHDNTVTWLAYWNDPINQKEFKYVFLAASSALKGKSDKEKYEKARMLKAYIHNIRSTYTKDFTSKDISKQQIAVATYLIDKLALRAGNEKDDDEADTVGCCTLKVENVELIAPNKLKLDFLGKDSIQYDKTVDVELPVFKAIGQFMKGKKGEDDLFDQLDTSRLNAHLKELMPGLTAKVFRTYNASFTLDAMLTEKTKDGDVAHKVVAYQHANKEVAVLCNHQRSESKSHASQISRLSEKMNELKGELEELRTDLARAKKGKPPLKGADGKIKKNVSPEVLERKISQTTVKIEKIERDIKTKEDLKTVALGTSKINYCDPRITVAWCKRHEVPIEKIFNKSLLAKFAWAMDADPSFRF